MLWKNGRERKRRCDIIRIGSILYLTTKETWHKLRVNFWLEINTMHTSLSIA